jgi:hypothetical protein
MRLDEIVASCCLNYGVDWYGDHHPCEAFLGLPLAHVCVMCCGMEGTLIGCNSDLGTSLITGIPSTKSMGTSVACRLLLAGLAKTALGTDGVNGS